MTVEEIINEIRIRADLSHIQDEELLDYINDLDDLMSVTHFPALDSVKVIVDDPSDNEFDVGDVTDGDRIEKVYIDGKKAIKKSAPDDLLDGWFFIGDVVSVSPDLLTENSELVITYREKHTPLNLDDCVMAVPEPFHDLYVFYTLAQISAKEADDVSYANFMKDYNSLLSEAMRRNAARQAYPEQQGWSK